MPDDADLATEHAEQLEALRRRVVPPRGPNATGYCLNCDAALADGVRWCDKNCLKDWERLAAR